MAIPSNFGLSPYESTPFMNTMHCRSKEEYDYMRRQQIDAQRIHDMGRNRYEKGDPYREYNAAVAAPKQNTTLLLLGV